MRMPGRWVAAVLLAAVALPACAPTIDPGTLAPTLTIEDRPAGSVAMQNGIPVPTFDWQPRRRIELSGTWRVDRELFDGDLSLTDRARSLEQIVAEGRGREQPEYDHRGWETISVPGTINAPPAEAETGAWYRHSFPVSAGWEGQVATLKFGAVNYLADVWLNGQWLGYHEGGYTPFAFDATAALRPGERNVIAVRVDNPAWGTRNDIVPWGLTDWWNYGGITRPVWLEATPPFHLVRADVRPHLDAADVSVLVRHAALAPPADEETPSPTLTPSPAFTPSPDEATTPSVHLEVLRARVTERNVTALDPRRLVPGDAEPIASAEVELDPIAPGEVAFANAAITFGGADPWSPAVPALYVLHARIGEEGEAADELWTTFGLRHVAVHPEQPRLLLNGEPTMFRGVGLHDEVLTPGATEEEVTARRIADADAALVQLERAREVGANLIRAAHTPANPLLLMLADRLGFAVWEEIPLYHFTPLTFDVAMDRGIPQQMLAEMALRDMNHPSVLFHGLANESTGEQERTDALRALHDLDRAIDGTRLTGQAAYGSLPDDPTHEPLDVAGFTFYYGVFYGDDPAGDTERALSIAHETHPTKPILALEFGRWADDVDGEALQRRIFEETYPVFARHSARIGGYMGAATWWTLEDYVTERPGIVIEHFGLFEPGGSPRPAGTLASEAFGAVTDPEPVAALDVESDARVARVEVPETGWRLATYVGYALLVSIGSLGLLVALLVRRGGRAAAPAQPSVNR